MTVTLSDNDVHIWYCLCDDPHVEAQQQRYLQLLTNDELDRYHRFAFEKDRRLFLVARSLLRTTLSRYVDVQPADWQFEQTLKGKLFVPEHFGTPPLCFNVSHSGQMAACVVTLNWQIGIDVESTERRTNPKVARYFMAPDELEQYRAADGDEQGNLFYRYWTLKESYAKALGLGLSLRLTNFSFQLSNHPHPTIVVEQSDDAAVQMHWHFHQAWIAPSYFLAVSVESDRIARPDFATYAEVP